MQALEYFWGDVYIVLYIFIYNAIFNYFGYILI